ncbi:hypothetical protein FACS189494_09850 [Spirochaetia bacterium]|nr:hypothetical protein FACS189494_09850 [Spirochaetia bacterium]
MKRLFVIAVFLFAVSDGCFAQNVMMIGGEYNYREAGYWDAGFGFNFMLLNEHLQDEIMINFGAIQLKKPNAEPKDYFLINIKDSLFFALNWKVIGLRIGGTLSIGAYAEDVGDFFFSVGGLAGLHIFPKSLISLSVDVCPSYSLRFFVSPEFKGSFLDGGFALPVAAILRLNLDRL